MVKFKMLIPWWSVDFRTGQNRKRHCEYTQIANGQGADPELHILNVRAVYAIK